MGDDVEAGALEALAVRPAGLGNDRLRGGPTNWWEVPLGVEGARGRRDVDDRHLPRDRGAGAVRPYRVVRLRLCTADGRATLDARADRDGREDDADTDGAIPNEGGPRRGAGVGDGTRHGGGLR